MADKPFKQYTIENRTVAIYRPTDAGFFVLLLPETPEGIALEIGKFSLVGRDLLAHPHRQKPGENLVFQNFKTMEEAAKALFEHYAKFRRSLEGYGLIGSKVQIIRNIPGLSFPQLHELGVLQQSRVAISPNCIIKEPLGDWFFLVSQPNKKTGIYHGKELWIPEQQETVVSCKRCGNFGISSYKSDQGYGPFNYCHSPFMVANPEDFPLPQNPNGKRDEDLPPSTCPGFRDPHPLLKNRP